MDSTELIRRCRGGDELAWEALVREHQGRVFGIALHYMRDREEARDAAQDVFIKVYSKLDSLKDGRPFLPWLLRLARNACIDRLRRLSVRKPDVAVPADEAWDLEGTGPTPEEACMANGRQRLLYRAIGTLSRASREMILLKEIQGLKLEEIADLLEVPLGTAKSRSHRAKLDLGRALRELTPEGGA